MTSSHPGETHHTNDGLLAQGMHGRYIDGRGTLCDFGPPELDRTHPDHWATVTAARAEKEAQR
jgi:hypothetical protein